MVHGAPIPPSTGVRLHLLSMTILGASMAAYLISVWRNSLRIWDDAFISFRFAQHLAEGHGFCWNIGGDRVEGFTSMLHVLLLAAGAKIGLRLESASLIIGIGSVVGTAALMAQMLRQCFGRLYPVAALFPAIYLIDWTTGIHSTTGLETQLFVFMLCAALACAIRFARRGTLASAVVLGCCLFLSVLCRPDGALYGAGLLAALVGHGVLPGTGGEKTLRATAALAAGVVVLLSLSAIYLVWKYNYFGYLLPNPFYVKSSEVSLQGLANVGKYLAHAAKWLMPPLIAVMVFVPMRSFRPALLPARAGTLALLALAPPALALLYYTVILHEVGGAHRFCYPSYFYFALIAAVLGASVVERARDRWGRLVLFGVPAAGSVLLLTIAAVQAAPLRKLPPTPIGAYHRRIGETLRDTGLADRAKVICVAAGAIPFISGFSHIDPVGLTDNYLSGRVPRSPKERNDYLWRQGADVYFGHEPPARAGSSGPQDDPAMQSPYVRDNLIEREMDDIEARFLPADPEILFDRMAELRDQWDMIGEIRWVGWSYWRLRSFVYVRKRSPFHGALADALRTLVDVKAADIDLARPPDDRQP